MDAVKIVLICPHCGHSVWIEREDEDYMCECLFCGELVYPEEMGHTMEKVEW